MRRVVVLGLLVLVTLLVGGALLARPARAAGPPAGQNQAGGCIRVGGSLTVPAGRHCRGDAVAIGGDLIVRGAVDGNAVAIGGSVRVEGRVRGDVVGLGGGGLLQDGAEVGGDVTVLGGVVYQAPRAIVRGSRLESDWPFPLWVRLQDRPAPPVWVRLEVTALATLLTFGVCLLLAFVLRSIWPQRTRAMVERLRHHLVGSLGMGLLSTALATLLLPLVSVLLLVTIVGIPIVPVAYLFVGLVYAAGLVIAGLALGEALAARKKGAAIPYWLRPALGLGILVPLAIVPGVLLPWVGPVWAALVPGGGVGAVVLSRVGTVAGRGRSG